MLNRPVCRQISQHGLVVVAVLCLTISRTAYAQQPVNVAPQLSMPNALQNSAPKSEPVRLQVYAVPSQFVGTVGAQLQLKFHGMPNVVVTTDPKTGQLMVMAPDAIHRQLGQEIAAFMKQNQIAPGDQGHNVASSGHQSYQLQHLSWRELEDAVQRLAGPKMSVTTQRNGELAIFKLQNASGFEDVLQVDRRLNVVTLLGSGASVAGWNQVVYTLDQGQADLNSLTHVVPLAPAEPRRVRRAIQLVKATLQQDGPEAGGQAEARVELGEDEQATAMGSIDSLSSDSGLFGEVQIEFIDDIGLVIIRGSKRDVQRTLEVIEKIKEQAAQTQPEVEVFQLQHANAQAVATLVTDLYATIFEPRQGAVSITALGQPNALLLIGRKEVVQSVQELVKKIDQPLGPQDQLKVIRLLHASAVDVESRIREFFVERPGSQDDVRVGIGSRVKVLADYRTNSLIIQAAPREMLEVEALINELDVEGTSAENELRVFRLKNTLSDDLQTVIEEVITGTAQGGNAGGGQNSTTPPSGKLSIVNINQGKISSGILAGVVITSDPSVNALVVRAPAQSMALIGELIDQLDRLPSAEARIKVFQLENGDALSLAQTLQQLFGLPATAGQGQTGGLFGGGNIQQAALTTGGESSLVQLQITYDTRTNSIIASGSSSDLEVIEVLLLRLDEEGIESRKTEVIWLRNANSDDVANALNTYLQNQRQAVQTTLVTGGIISLSEQVDREVFVVSEPQTNSILLSATPRYFETMLEVVNRLDRRPPLVAIQCLIAEVQLDDNFQFGAEMGIQDGLLFDRQSASGGTLGSPVFNLGGTLTGPSGTVGQTQNLAGQALSSFGVGRANATGIGGAVLSASSESVGILVRALQTANRIEVLGRPEITTLDSRESRVLVGQRVPRVSGVTQTVNGQTVNNADVDVGLELGVLPRVNQDGLILMQVQIQNSSVGPTDSGIPVGFGPNGEVIRSPIINTTEAQTTVSAYAGQTVVIAGLISKSRSSTRTQIPVLGSLPIIGAAFRFDTETEQRRELLVVLTPRLIQTDEDYEILKQVESSRMSWCIADVLNVHGDVGLSGGNGLWGPARSPVIYPDIAPTVLDDKSKPRSQYGNGEYFDNNYIDGYPLDPNMMEPEMILSPAIAPELETGAQSARTQVPVQAASFQQMPGVPPVASPLPRAQNGGY